jgi:hypothetical protein
MIADAIKNYKMKAACHVLSTCLGDLKNKQLPFCVD